jgi:hypothetical protein
MGLEAVYERASCASRCTLGDEDAASFADLDADGNGDIDREEFAEAFGATGLDDDFDADQHGTIDEDGFNQSVFDLLDEDGDEVIGESEFGPHVDVHEDVFL